MLDCSKEFKNLLHGEILMNEGNSHAAFPYTARYPLDGVVAHISRAKNARQASFQGERWALKFPCSQVSTGANVSVGVAFENSWQP